MKLILVRHGRSIANDAKVHQGKKDEWRDTFLHERGINQAKEVANRLKNEKIDEIYSSPLKRARETAEKIAMFHRLDIKIDKRLEDEKDEESQEEFIVRCKEFFNELKIKNKTILVVTHAAVIVTLLAISTQDRGKGSKLVQEISSKIKNTSISIIEDKNDSFERNLMGCVEHRSDV